MRVGLLECGVALTVVASGYAVYAYFQKERTAAEKAITAQLNEDIELRMRLKLEDEKRLAAKNDAWARCISAGDRPVLGGLTTVVCIKREAVAWEFRIP